MLCFLALITVNVTDAGDLSNPVCTSDPHGKNGNLYVETS